MIQAINIPPNRPLAGTAPGFMPPLFQHPNSRVERPPPRPPCPPDRLVYSCIVWDRHGSSTRRVVPALSLTHQSITRRYSSLRLRTGPGNLCSPTTFVWCPIVISDGLMLSWYSWAQQCVASIRVPWPWPTMTWINFGVTPRILDIMSRCRVVMYCVRAVSDKSSQYTNVEKREDERSYL